MVAASCISLSFFIEFQYHTHKNQRAYSGCDCFPLNSILLYDCTMLTSSWLKTMRIMRLDVKQDIEESIKSEKRLKRRYMIYYRVALQAGRSNASRWECTVFTPLAVLFCS